MWCAAMQWMCCRAQLVTVQACKCISAALRGPQRRRRGGLAACSACGARVRAARRALHTHAVRDTWCRASCATVRGKREGDPPRASAPLLDCMLPHVPVALPTGDAGRASSGIASVRAAAWMDAAPPRGQRGDRRAAATLRFRPCSWHARGGAHARGATTEDAGPIPRMLPPMQCANLRWRQQRAQRMRTTPTSDEARNANRRRTAERQHAAAFPFTRALLDRLESK
jgi:hypothetical protein